MEWSVQNERHLRAALSSLRRTLGIPGDGEPAPVETGAETSSLERLTRVFGLSPFERAVLLLCAAVELDGGVAEAFDQLTFGTALAVLPDGHWTALSPGGPLRYWRLLEVGEGSLTSAPLRIDERVLHHLVGVDYLDDRLDGLVGPHVALAELPHSHERLAVSLAAAWQEADLTTCSPIALLGPDAGAKPSIAAAACRRLGLCLRTLPAGAIPAAAVELDGLRRLWTREAMLHPSALLLDCEGVEGGDTPAAVAFLEGIRVPVFIASAWPLRLLRRPILRTDVPRPTAEEQRALWHDALGPDAFAQNGTLDDLVAQFDLGTHAIQAARVQALGPAAGASPMLRLWDACRAQARPKLDELAQRIEPAVGWNDLVVPDAQKELLREIAIHVRHRTQVYERWGFAGKGRRGLGISALFVGSSGTGKTMAAEVLAQELRLDLYRIDLSSVVSKYIGETEKNLRRVFDAAEESGTILLFDEADALFGKRTEVKDSHDRYANIEISYLLQRMEAYRGLAILTTNFRSALDTAFLRRIRFVVEFPFPNAAQREEIWSKVFPDETPTDGLDVSLLAQLTVAGGNVRNIALGAAFLAAEARAPVAMSHVLQAARGEYAKLEKPLTGTEIGGWS